VVDDSLLHYIFYLGMWVQNFGVVLQLCIKNSVEVIEMVEQLIKQVNYLNIYKIMINIIN
jgi:hypothetical protein